MKVTCVVQARMGSRRLPGKVLADIGGLPLLAFMLRRLDGIPVDHLVVATTEAPEDDPVASVASKEGAEVVRGSELDVLERFRLALERFPSEVVVRLTADCPLADPQIVTDALKLHDSLTADYTSNTLVRTFPDGLDVEVMGVDALRSAASEAERPEEREHVTPFIYRRPERFNLKALRLERDISHERWTVDTLEDLAFVRSVVPRLASPRAPWRDIMRVAGLRNAPPPGQVRLRPPIASDGHLIGRRALRHLADPSVRIWVAELDDVVVGWVRVDVEGGHGRLAFETGPRNVVDVVTSLQAALRADYQVEQLVVEGEFRDAAAGLFDAGFEKNGRTLVWRR